jgi:hypothetical protein
LNRWKCGNKNRVETQQPGVLEEGLFDSSWTTLVFCFFPAMLHGDYITFIGGFVISIIIAIFTLDIGAFFIGLVWASVYKKYYTRRLLDNGQEFNASEKLNAQAFAALSVARSKQAHPIRVHFDLSVETSSTRGGWR